MERTIFISIAAFMDPLLENTIENMIKMAEYPERLVFGICIQDEEEKMNNFVLNYNNKQNFRILCIHPNNSQGCCWVRAKIQSLMKNEHFFMQTDSHHAYVKHWDSLCIEMIDQCETLSGHSDVVLSTYGTPCTLPNFSCTHEDAPYYMKCEKFYDIPKIRYVPHKIPDGKDEPRLWHTISAHFLFTHKKWIEDVPYDPTLYFDGEEDTLALRSYTNGYDIYYPYKTISYHYYTRSGEKRHSDMDKEWWKINEKSISHLRDILHGKVTGKYGLGTVRSLTEYMKFTDIDYINEIICTPQEHSFGNSKFVQIGKDWIENETYKFHQLTESDEFTLLYDNRRKLFAKLVKQTGEIQLTSNLTDWTYIPKTTDKLLYGNRLFTKIDSHWIESDTTDSSVKWNFIEAKNSKNYICLFDSSRHFTLKLFKYEMCIQAKWPTQKQFITIFGTSPKENLQKSLHVTFGMIGFKKTDAPITWTETCKNKKKSFKLKEIVSNADFYILYDTNRKAQYKLFKDLSRLDLKIDHNKWITLFTDGIPVYD